jgi:hypothetical protein
MFARIIPESDTHVELFTSVSAAVWDAHHPGLVYITDAKQAYIKVVNLSRFASKQHNSHSTFIIECCTQNSTAAAAAATATATAGIGPTGTTAESSDVVPGWADIACVASVNPGILLCRAEGLPTIYTLCIPDMWFERIGIFVSRANDSTTTTTTTTTTTAVTTVPMHPVTLAITSAVTCMSVSYDGSQLAIGRADGMCDVHRLVSNHQPASGAPLDSIDGSHHHRHRRHHHHHHHVQKISISTVAFELITSFRAHSGPVTAAIVLVDAIATGGEEQCKCVYIYCVVCCVVLCSSSSSSSSSDPSSLLHRLSAFVVQLCMSGIYQVDLGFALYQLNLPVSLHFVLYNFQSVCDMGEHPKSVCLCLSVSLSLRLSVSVHPSVSLFTYLPPLTSHLSPLTSHLSPLTSHLSPLTSHLSPLRAIRRLICTGGMRRIARCWHCRRHGIRMETR